MSLRINAQIIMEMIEKMALYKISSLESDKTRGVAHIQVDSKHPVFKGHFPGNPITPGACLIQIGVELIQLSESEYSKIEQIRNAKFVKMVKPDDHEVVFKWEIKTRNDQYIKVSFTITKQDIVAANYNIHFTK